MIKIIKILTSSTIFFLLRCLKQTIIFSVKLGSADDFCILLPDIPSTKLLVFLRCLLNGNLKSIDRTTFHVLKDVASILGTLHGLVQENDLGNCRDSRSKNTIVDSEDNIDEIPDKSEYIEQDEIDNGNSDVHLSNDYEPNSVGTFNISDGDALNNKCLLTLASVDIDQVT